MSWDILLLKHQIDLDDPHVEAPEPLGERLTVIAQLQELLPALDFSDPSWGLLDTADYSIEFNMGREALTDSIMLHVRGGGNPLAAIQHVCAATGWAAYNCQDGAFLVLEAAASSSWERFQQYRDQVLGHGEETKPA